MNRDSIVLAGVAVAFAIGHSIWRPFPAPGGNPVLDLAALHDPVLHYQIRMSPSVNVPFDAIPQLRQQVRFVHRLPHRIRGHGGVAGW